MLGSRVPDLRRPHATFLLPSFPGFLRRPKRPPTRPSIVVPTAFPCSSVVSSRASTESGPGSVGPRSMDSDRGTSSSAGTPPESCYSSPVTTTSTTTTTTTPRLARAHPDTLRCRRCTADLAFAAQIVSKGFTGRHGRAYLVSPPGQGGHRFAPNVPSSAFPTASSSSSSSSSDDDDLPFDRALFRDPAHDRPLANIRIGRPETRQLLTGAHVVADVACSGCGARLGWTYVDARDAAQRYKVGKFILDVARVMTFRSWEDDDDEFEEYEAYDDEDNDDDDDAVSFDSSDDEECEEIFAGTWDASTVAARRRKRAREACAAV